MTIVISSCASTYKPSQKAVDFQKTMSLADANKILAENLSFNKTSTGVCEVGGLSYKLDKKSKVKLVDGVIYISNAYEKGKEIERTKDLVKFEKLYVNKEIQITDIDKIRIQLEGETHFCYRTKGGNIFQALISPLQWFAFDVRTQDLDKVIAAVSKVNPDIKLVTGTGF